MEIREKKNVFCGIYYDRGGGSVHSGSFGSSSKAPDTADSVSSLSPSSNICGNRSPNIKLFVFADVLDSSAFIAAAVAALVLISAMDEMQSSMMVL